MILMTSKEMNRFEKAGVTVLVLGDCYEEICPDQQQRALVVCKAFQVWEDDFGRTDGVFEGIRFRVFVKTQEVASFFLRTQSLWGNGDRLFADMLRGVNLRRARRILGVA
jgi:hypothetical protein